MGNRTIHDVLEEEKWERSAFAHYEKEHNWNDRPYPSWWPSNYETGHGFPNLERLNGFPYLSFWYLEQGGFRQFPPIHLELCTPPNEAMLKQVPTIKRLEQLWLQSSSPPKKEDVEIENLRAKYEQTIIGGKSVDEVKQKIPWKQLIGDPGADFCESSNAWQSWLVENCPNQLNFFGVPFKGYESQIFNQKSLYFKNALTYYPGKWVLMVYLSLCIHIVHLIEKHPKAPYIPWAVNQQVMEERLINEHSYLNFPVSDSIINRNIPFIKQYLKQHRGECFGCIKSIFIVKENEMKGYNPFKKDYNLDLLLVFKQLWDDGDFSKLDKIQLHLLFAQPFARNRFFEMIQSIKKKQGQENAPPLRILYQIIDFYSIESHPFSTYKSINDLIMWILVCMYVDFKNNDDLKSHLESEKPNPKNMDEFKRFIQLMRSTREERVRTEKAIQEDKMVQVDQKSGRLIHIGDPAHDGPYVEPPSSMSDPKLKDFLDDYRIKWRSTALWSFLSFYEVPWPPKQLENPFTKDSFEHNVVNFISAYPPRRLLVPSWNFKEVTRFSSDWEKVFGDQYKDYLVWVEHNVNASKNPIYHEKKFLPGQHLVDKDGHQIYNYYPDYGILDEEKNSALYTASTVLLPFVTAAFELIFGGKVKKFLSEVGQKIWDAVKEFLSELFEKLKGAFPSLLLIGAVAVGGLLAYDFVSTKVEKLAS